MDQAILSISGKPGLFRLVSRGRATLIIETIDEQKKRSSVGLRDRVTSLNDISIYTDDEDVPLMEVFANIAKLHNSQPVEMNFKTATKDDLADFMAEALPNFDRDRVYPSDMKKVVQWYNILVKNGYTDFSLPTEPETEADTEAEAPAEA